MFGMIFDSVLRFAVEYNEHFSSGMAYLGALGVNQKLKLKS